MPDNVIFILSFIFFEKFFSAAECNLIQIFIYFFFCHSHTAIADCERLFFCIEYNIDPQFTDISFCFADRRQRFYFLRRIYCITDKFPYKNVMFTVKELLNDRKNILCLYPYTSFLHIILVNIHAHLSKKMPYYIC